MPRPRLPLTPASSGDITAREKDKFGSPTGGEMSFALPPPAMEESMASSTTKAGGFVMSMASPELHASLATAETHTKTRPLRNKSAAAAPKRQLDEFNLPPPPTRARKIIQMTPKTQQSRAEKQKDTTASTGTNENSGAKSASSGAGPMAASSGVKKKQPSATSAAGRKIARKTAHSLIERRRRSKMNEEFATLKDMIPACNGQEMHKLAILQASIDYVSYLERCVSNLKTASRGTVLPSPPTRPMVSSPTSPAILAEYENEESPENAMDISDPQTQPTPLALSPTSPNFQPQSQPQFHQFHHTILPSPILHPSHGHQHRQHKQTRPSACPSVSTSASASPAIAPQSNNGNTSMEDVDHEATTAAALLMLNVDRRAPSISGPASASMTRNQDQFQDRDRDRGPGGGQEKKNGMRVMDLLSS